MLYRAFAAVHTGRYIEAENILYADGGLVVPDIKEGEVSMSELWYLIPVSYTHLDVYKRQVKYCALYVLLKLTMYPVSYTHLLQVKRFLSAAKSIN